MLQFVAGDLVEQRGRDVTALDPATRPADDLFAHVNGLWITSHTIPADRASDGVLRALRDRSEEQVRDIITELGRQVADGQQQDDDAAKIGAAFASFMDTQAIEAAGLAPLRTDLALIEQASTQAELTGALGALQRTGAGGAGGTFETGRFVKAGGQPMSNLFLSMADRMGVKNLERFGDSNGRLASV